MAQQTINIGAAANDHSGDPLRTAGSKINANFTELYAGGVGGGGDPLSLTQGLSIAAINPTIGSNPNDRMAANFFLATDIANTTPQFTNTEAISIRVDALHGQGIYNANQQAKHTFFTQANMLVGYGSGQKFLYNDYVYAYGMSDSAVGQHFVQFAGGPIVGDEGQGFRLVSRLSQQAHLTIVHITAVTAPCTLNTTATQVINASSTAQTINVASVPVGSIAVGNWVVVAQEAPTSGPEMEAVQITGFSNGTPGTISGVFRGQHPTGRTITPALRLTLDNVTEMGQDRVLVNLSGSSYSTGNIASISGGGFTGGGGASWSNSMVGGHALNIGAISLDADNYTGGPFGFGTTPNVDLLRSWFQIQSIVSPTSMAIMTTSVAGDASYQGRGVATTNTYVIRPCARVLRIVNSGSNFTGEIICETSTSTWTVGNTVELAICPYADVTGFSYDTLCFTNGGHYRSHLQMRNLGPRAFASCIDINDLGGGFQTAPAGDGKAFGTIMALSAKCDYGINLSASNCGTAAIILGSAASGGSFTDTAGKILWGNTPFSITPNSANNGLDFNTGNATLSFVARNKSNNPSTDQELMNWGGRMRLLGTGTVSRGMIVIDRDISDLTDTNICQGILRWNAINFPLDFGIVTKQAGSGTSAADITLSPNGVEAFRCVVGSTVQFSASPSWSANGSVATALTSLGPSGSHTTVQKWLTVKDNTGTTLYIPCF